MVEPHLPKSLKMADGAPQLLACVAAQRGIKLAVACRETVQRDPVARHLGLPSVEAAPRDGLARQVLHRTADIQFVRVARTVLGEPADQRLVRGLAMPRRDKQPV